MAEQHPHTGSWHRNMGRLAQQARVEPQVFAVCALLGQARCTVFDTAFDWRSPWPDGYAVFLPVGTQLYALRGYSARFRVAERSSGSWRLPARFRNWLRARSQGHFTGHCKDKECFRYASKESYYFC